MSVPAGPVQRPPVAHPRTATRAPRFTPSADDLPLFLQEEETSAPAAPATSTAAQAAPIADVSSVPPATAASAADPSTPATAVTSSATGTAPELQAATASGESRLARQDQEIIASAQHDDGAIASDPQAAPGAVSR